MKSIEEYIKALVDTPAESAINAIDGFRQRLIKFQNERPTELAGFKKHINMVNKFRTATSSALKLELSLESVRVIIMDDFAKEQDEWLHKQEEEASVIDQEILALKESIEESNRQHNAQLVAGNEADNANYVALEEKRKILESYSDKIFSMCSQYGITTSMVSVDESQYTFDELNKLYDGYIAYMNKESKGTNVIAKLRTMVPNEMVQGGTLLVLLFLCMTKLLDFISIGFFLLLAANQIQNMDRFKYYSVLLAIVFNIKPENMGYTALDESRMLPEELTDEMLDTDERFSGFEEKYNALDEKYASTNPALAQTKFISDWQQAMSTYQEKINEYIKVYDEKVKALVDDIDAELKLLDEQYEDLKSKYKFIGDRWSKHLTFSGSYVLGLHDDCVEETVDCGTKNIIIRPNGDENLMRKFLQALMVNAMGNVLPGNLDIDIYDPNDFGQKLTPLYTSDLKDNIKFYNDELKNVMQALIDYCQDNFKRMSGRTINEFNQHCEESGITPIPYKLLIILSQPKTMEEDEQLQSFIKYSATGGVYIWVVSDKIESEDCFVFNKPFEGVQNPIADKINDDWCRQVSRNFHEAIKAAAPPALLWKDFEDNIFSKKLGKIWSGDASKFIDFFPGYENGDPTLFTSYTLGNEGNVHAIGVGTSGAGKSVFLNHLVNTMCREYSPKELELWLCDFKGVEFKAYMKLARLKAARLCRPQKVVEGDIPSKTEEDQEVFGYYRCEQKEEGTEYIFSPEPTDDCKELHKFTQKLDKKGPNKGNPKKNKDGTEKPPLPKGDQDFEDNIEYYALPHISACLCTSDGAFATSLFKAFRTKAERRYDDLGFISVKNMPGWNSKVKGLIGSRKPDKMIETHTKLWKETNFNPIWSEDDLWPRILFICDEFQVIFQKADPKDVETIKGDIQYIAKVARACGMHIFFTSQSMKGTISADILANFTLRFALRCEPEVSMDIIGSKRASEIREKNGYLIVQSQEMKTPEDQKRYKTPFLNDEPGSGFYTESELFDNIRMLNNLAIEQKIPEHDVIAYDEKTTHKIEELYALYERLDKEGKKPEQGLFFLGNRMAYSTNKAPDNIILSARNNTNILACFSDTTDFVQFFKQMIVNIKCNKVSGTVIINSQVEDLTYLTDAEQEITFPDKHGHILSNKNTCVSVIDWCEKLVNTRKANDRKDTPIWIFLLGWDKGKGFAIEPDSAKRAKLAAMMQTAGEFNIHFIIMTTSMTGIAQSIISACKHRIAGKCSMEDSVNLIGNKSASLNYDIKTGWMFSWNDGVVTRDKIYVSPITKEIASSEIIL